MTTTTKAWLHSIAAAFISAFATAMVGALALPTVFNLTHDGLANIAKITLVPALLAVFNILKQSPLPTASVTVTKTSSVEVTPTGGAIVPLVLFALLLGSFALTGCNDFERTSFQTLSASKAVIDTAQADYEAHKLPKTACTKALIESGKVAQTVAVNALMDYDKVLAAHGDPALTQAAVISDLASLAPMVAQVKTLYTNPTAVCGGTK